MAKDGLQEKLTNLIHEQLSAEDESIKNLVLMFLMTCMKKRNIVSMKNAVKTVMDEELDKMFHQGIIEYDENDEKYDFVE